MRAATCGRAGAAAALLRHARRLHGSTAAAPRPAPVVHQAAAGAVADFAPRSGAESGAQLVKADMLTSTVRRLRFEVHDKSFTFAPGQWLDCLIPGTDHIGGFSPTSSPRELPRLELAVKLSARSAPSRVAVRESAVGDEWQFRVGGALALPPALAASADPSARLLFVAGGIGITPLFSMIRHLDLTAGSARAPRMALLHSGKEIRELAFHDSLAQLARRRADDFRYQAHATARDAGPWCVETCTMGRVRPRHLDAALNWLQRRPSEESAAAAGPASQAAQPPLCFLCGPRGFSPDVRDALQALGVPADRIRFENWW